MRTIPIAFLLFAATGCLRSFDLSPIAASRMKRGQKVETLDEGVVEVPEDYEATVVFDRRGPARVMYPEDPHTPGGARLVPTEAVREGHDNDYDDGHLALATPIEVGVAPMGMAPAAARGLPLPRRVGGPVLWVRDEDGRVLELPLSYVRHINVDIDMPVGGWVGIIGGSIGGGVAFALSLILGVREVSRPSTQR